MKKLITITIITLFAFNTFSQNVTIEAITRKQTYTHTYYAGFMGIFYDPIEIICKREFRAKQIIKKINKKGYSIKREGQKVYVMPDHFINKKLFKKYSIFKNYELQQITEDL